jgi:hypothetical protein
MRNLKQFRLEFAKVGSQGRRERVFNDATYFTLRTWVSWSQTLRERIWRRKPAPLVWTFGTIDER